MNRCVVVLIVPTLIQMILTKGWRCGADGDIVECVEGLPDGARYVRGFYDAEKGLVGLVFEHESFKEVPWGGAMPEILPVITRKTAVKA